MSCQHKTPTHQDSAQPKNNLKFSQILHRSGRLIAHWNPKIDTSAAANITCKKAFVKSYFSLEFTLLLLLYFFFFFYFIFVFGGIFPGYLKSKDNRKILKK